MKSAWLWITSLFTMWAIAHEVELYLDQIKQEKEEERKSWQEGIDFEAKGWRQFFGFSLREDQGMFFVQRLEIMEKIASSIDREESYFPPTKQLEKAVYWRRKK